MVETGIAWLTRQVGWPASQCEILGPYTDARGHAYFTIKHKRVKATARIFADALVNPRRGPLFWRGSPADEPRMVRR
jgi:hypothetical protein